MELCFAPEGDDVMVTCEMEAIEALAALARCTAERGGGGLGSPHQKKVTAVTASPRSCQDRAIAVFNGNASPTVTSALNTEENIRTVPGKLCDTSNQPHTASKLRKNFTEAEKEARRLRRVLANRESARQTIRRRQAMHLGLMMKAADLNEENENLKKEKELAVKEYDSLKGRNEFLKLQMANVTKAEPSEIQEAPKSSQAEIATSSTISSPNFLYNQPSLVPFFWPSNVIQLQYASHSDVMSSSQSSFQHQDTPSSHLGREISLVSTGPGSPLFVLPVPWFLPLPGFTTTLHYNSDTDKRQNGTPSTHQCSVSSSSQTIFVEDCHEQPSYLNMRVEASSHIRSMSVGSSNRAGVTYPVNNGDHYTGHHPKVTHSVPEKLSSVRPMECFKTTRHSLEDNIHNLSAVSDSQHISQILLKKNPEPINKKPENMFAATKARRRRKELMKLKNIQYPHVRYLKNS